MSIQCGLPFFVSFFVSITRSEVRVRLSDEFSVAAPSSYLFSGRSPNHGTSQTRMLLQTHRTHSRSGSSDMSLKRMYSPIACLFDCQSKIAS